MQKNTFKSFFNCATAEDSLCGTYTLLKFSDPARVYTTEGHIVVTISPHSNLSFSLSVCLSVCLSVWSATRPVGH